MAVPLRVLILEDRQTDSELVVHELRRAGFVPDWQRVDTEADYFAHLDLAWDIILADYSLPQWDAPRALEVLQDRGLDIPFIIVSGMVGEDKAVECMKQGADDYLLKDRLDRLGPAITKALDDKRLRVEKEQAEERLRHSEAALKRAQHVAHVGSWTWHIQANRLEWSDEMYRIFGIETEGFSGSLEDVITQAIHPDDRAKVEASNLSVINAKQPIPLEYRVIRPDHSIRVVWAEAGQLIVDDAGNPALLTGIVQDITERKNAEEALRESEARYRNMFNNSPVGVFQSTPFGRYRLVNPAFARMLGYDSPDEVLRAIEDISILYVDPRDREEVKHLFKAHGKLIGHPIHYVHRSGQERWMSVFARAVYDDAGAISYYDGFALDITERKNAEEALRESEEQYRRLAETTRDLILLHDMEGRIVYINQIGLELTGLQQETSIGQSVDVFVPQEYRQDLASRHAQRSDGETDTYRYEIELVNQEGERIPFEVNSTPVLRDGQVSEILLVARDITERKQTEQALRESEQFAHSTLNGLSAHIAIMDESGTILAVNASWRRFAITNEGTLADLCEGANYLAVCDRAQGSWSEGAKEFAAAIRAVLNGAQNHFEFEYPCHSPSEQRWFVGRITPFPGEGPARAVIAHEDITRSKLAELQLTKERTLLRTLIDSMPDRVYAKDVKGRFILKNEIDARQMGAATTEEVIGKTDFDYYPRKIAEQYHADDMTVIQSGQPLLNREEPIIDAEGNRGWILTSKVPLRDNQGTVIGLIGIGRDITERKQAAAELERYTNRLNILHTIDRAILAAQSPEEIAGVAVAHIQQVVNPYRLVVLAFDPETGAARTLAVVGSGATQLATGTILPPENILGLDQLRERQTVVVEDIAAYTESPAVQALLAEGVRSIINIPLFFQDRLLGVIGLGHEQPGSINAEHLDIIREIGDQIAVAVTQANLHEAERRQRTLAEALADTAAIFSSTLNLDEILERILDNVGRVVTHEAADVLLIDAHKDTARIVRCRGYAPEQEETILALRFPVMTTPNLRQIIQTGQPLAIPDTQADPGWVTFPQTHWIRSSVTVPIHQEGKIIGFLGLHSATPGTFTPIQAARLQAFANQAGVALHNATLFNEAQQRTSESRQLYEAGKQLGRTLELETIYDTAYRVIHEIMPCDDLVVSSYNPHNNLIRCVHMRHEGIPLDVSEFPPIPLEPEGQGTQSVVIRTGESLYRADYRAHWKSATASYFVDEEGIVDHNEVPEDEDITRSALIVPLKYEDRVIGVVQVLSYRLAAFSKSDLRFLEALATQVSAATMNARLYRELEVYSDTLEQAVQERTAELNSAKERIEAILNSSSDVMILCRMDGTIEQVNPAFDKTFKAKVNDVFNQPLTMLVVPEHAATMEQSFAAVKETQQPQRLEIAIGHKELVAFDADVVLSPIADQNSHLLGIICSLRDITQHKQLEGQLHQMLEHEMEVSELKSRYVSMAAHDLRNPLAIIQSSVSLIHQYGNRLSEEKKQQKYDNIQTSIQIMVTMLDDILTLGKAESGKLTFEPAPLDVVAFCQRIATEIGQTEVPITSRIMFSSQGKCNMAYMDAKLLRHILDNLLSNALKYSPEEKPVNFTVFCEPDQIVFSVQDQGIGIPEADQEKLFETFHRASNARQIPGTGLGLAIVKQSAKLHGGTITFESKEGGSTTFTVVIPQAPFSEK